MNGQDGFSRRRILFLGCGFMGTALLKTLLQQDKSGKWHFSAHVRTVQSLDRLKAELEKPVKLSFGNENIAQAVAGADVVFLCCSPSDLHGILQGPNVTRALSGKVIISILAGVSVAKLRDSIASASAENAVESGSLQCIRIIPTLGCQIGESVTLVAEPSVQGHSVSDPTLIDELLSGFGSIHHVPEELMNEMTAIGAAVHALSIVVLDGITDVSVAEGVPRSAASALAASCLRSASGLFQSGMTPEKMKVAMSTPNGITLNAVVNLEQQGVRSGAASTVRQAIRYTREMGK